MVKSSTFEFFQRPAVARSSIPGLREWSTDTTLPAEFTSRTRTSSSALGELEKTSREQDLLLKKSARVPSTCGLNIPSYRFPPRENLVSEVHSYLLHISTHAVLFFLPGASTTSVRSSGPRAPPSPSRFRPAPPTPTSAASSWTPATRTTSSSPRATPPAPPSSIA